ncbi:potassium channel family protein [Bacillus sp. 165]|uniref:potassium channel family protein n=1 Tax=Bacillus sp. 165 TaxID=1529117 RepID=UPI001ADB5923|nr:potassium channel family protein [Bacillus sp. 165]MBO9130950.1 two pore domain potassium channel family protein [Bacillus sp. 165]
MIWVVVLALVIVSIGKSVQALWVSTHVTRHFFSFHNLLLLCLIYTTVLVAFGLSYIVLEEMGLPVLEEDGKDLDVHSFQIVEICMYFSAITLLSVGYGDIIPIGIGRWIAIVEALVGYTMPAAFVVHSVMENEKTS